MPVDKSKWNISVKVSQKTIDDIKKMGMDKALKTVAGASKASSQDASAKEWVEGVKRLYGANRVAAATKSTPKPTTSSRGGASSMDAAYASSKPKATPAKPKPTQTSSKTSTTSNPFTALHNAVSPYGNKNQKFKSPLPSGGAASRKPVPGKPSVGEQINQFIGSLGKHPSASQVEAEMARRAGMSVAKYRSQKNK